MADYPAFYAKIDEYKKRPFVWGEADCCLFVADALIALTGTDYAAPFRGKYTTATGAMKALAPYGGLSGYLDSVFQRVPVNMAQRGDIIMAGDGVYSAGIVAGRDIWFMDNDGVKPFDRKQGKLAWRVL